MKEYLKLQLEILYLDNIDVITYSNGKDNDIDDDNWFDEEV